MTTFELEKFQKKHVVHVEKGSAAGCISDILLAPVQLSLTASHLFSLFPLSTSPPETSGILSSVCSGLSKY